MDKFTGRFSSQFTIRWADLDANVHMRHSAYNDYAAQTRVLWLAEHGFDMDWFRENNLYPILFREEVIFLKEIRGNETITIDVNVLKISDDGSRWTIKNNFYKADGILAAHLTVDGAWLDGIIRKLKAPQADMVALFKQMEQAATRL